MKPQLTPLPVLLTGLLCTPQQKKSLSFNVSHPVADFFICDHLLRKSVLVNNDEWKSSVRGSVC